MTGTAIGVLVASQSDLNLSGVGREQQMALYAAEYAVARAKGLVMGEMVSMYNSTNGWNGLLTSSFPEITSVLCDPNSAPIPGASPGLKPKTGIASLAGSPSTLVPMPLYTITDRAGNPTGQGVSWNFCIHNNAEDPGFLHPTGAPTGNVDDSLDTQHLLTIEAWGVAPNNALVHLSVSVGPPALAATGGTNSYAQEGAGSAHTGNGGSSEIGVTIASGPTVKF